MPEINENTIKRLDETANLTDDEFAQLIETDEFDSLLFQYAEKKRRSVYGNDIYIRGLIEFTNYCKNNCYYCGIRAENKNCSRYRLTMEDILNCCREGYSLGFRTFVLQGGEDMYFTDDKMCEIISEIRNQYPNCAITLSIGEKSKETYQKFYESGANRYLLRHETADSRHYGMLHPKKQDLESRKRCLFDLKEIGYQVGAGFMVQSPFQTTETLVSDLRFLQDLKPDMIGIGPFIPHKDTPFAGKKQGTLSLTLRMLAILRLMFPYVLLPATTALGTIDPLGREKGIKAGANVVMPNLSPLSVRKKYELYNNKICTGEESAQCRDCLEKRVNSVGCHIVTDVGDVKRSVKS